MSKSESSRIIHSATRKKNNFYESKIKRSPDENESFELLISTKV